MKNAVNTISSASDSLESAKWADRHAELLVRQQCLAEMLPDGVTKESLRELLARKVAALTELANTNVSSAPPPGRLTNLVDLGSESVPQAEVLRSITAVEGEIDDLLSQFVPTTHEFSTALDRLKKIQHDLFALIAANSR